MISTTAVHASSMASTPTPVNDDEYEFDFLAAATQAAIEREAREAPSETTPTYYSKTPARTEFTAPTAVTNEEDYEFDFLAAATQAAVERETQANQKVDDPSPFKVYQAFVPKANANRLSLQ